MMMMYALTYAGISDKCVISAPFDERIVVFAVPEVVRGGVKVDDIVTS